MTKAANWVIRFLKNKRQRVSFVEYIFFAPGECFYC